MVAACTNQASPSPTDRTSARPRVTIGSTLEPPATTGLDLTKNPAAAIPEVLRDNVLEGLVRLDEKGNVQPSLAKTYEQSPDGKVYTFHLVTAKFHDGTPLSASDVVFSFNRARAPGSGHPFRSHFDAVDAVVATDEKTVKVTLKQFSFNWLFFMTQGSGVILSEKSIGSIATNPVGTGPFKFDRWIRGDSIRLVRNPDYWGQRPPLEEAVFKYIQDPNAMNNALLAGDIDVISRLTGPEQLQAFKDNPRFKVLDGQTSSKVILAMNNKAGPLADVRVRRAISYAIDRKSIVDGSQAGHGRFIGSHTVPGPSEPYYIDLTGVYPHDANKAKALLAQAGFPNGFTLSLKLPPPSYARRGGEIIASELAEIGIKTTITPLESIGAWVDVVLVKKQYDLSIIAHVEPRDIAQYGNAQYYWGYVNPQVQDWLASADREQNEAKRNELYAKVQRQITDDAVNAWLYMLPNIVVLRSEITGYRTDRLAPSINLTEVRFKS
jgi:peptide/nickel transport system substrate-binding protein